MATTTKKNTKKQTLKTLNYTSLMQTVRSIVIISKNTQDVGLEDILSDEKLILELTDHSFVYYDPAEESMSKYNNLELLCQGEAIHEDQLEILTDDLRDGNGAELRRFITELFIDRGNNNLHQIYLLTQENEELAEDHEEPEIEEEG